jgi:hypothetical protein
MEKSDEVNYENGNALSSGDFAFGLRRFYRSEMDFHHYSHNENRE